ncbi:LOC111597534 [Sergentomyia squamirostris]
MAENSEPIKYNKDELVPPDFLNEEFLQNVLEKDENDKNLKITKFDIIPGSKAGDHFASVMFKAIVSYTTKGKSISGRSLIIKTMPVDDGFKKEMLSEMNVFGREIEMYSKVLPEMKRIMESIGDKEELGPRCVYYSTDPVTIIFDDITKYGYEMYNDGFFGFDNVIKIVKKLAKYHALSYYMNDNKYNNKKIDFSSVQSLMKDSMIDTMKNFFGGIDYLQKELVNWPGFEVIAEKMLSQTDRLTNMLPKIYQPNPDSGINVLCHGDFHIKNMMFIKSGQDIDKVMFLDYQISFWGSPAIDLIYVLYAISDFDARERRGEIISIYHQAFCDYLTRLGCLKKPFSLLELNIELLEKGTMEIFWSCCLMPLFCMDMSKLDLEAMVTPTDATLLDFRQMMYKNEVVVKTLKKVLPDLLYKGILD